MVPIYPTNLGTEEVRKANVRGTYCKHHNTGLVSWNGSQSLDAGAGTTKIPLIDVMKILSDY